MSGLEIVRAPLPRAIAMDWKTVQDISGTGKAVAKSDLLRLPFPDVDFYDLTLEVSRILAVVDGTGVCMSSVELSAYQGDITTTASTDAPIFVTGFLKHGSTTGQPRRSLFKPSVIQASWGDLRQEFYVRVTGSGSKDDTEWVVRDIKMRVIYVPL